MISSKMFFSLLWMGCIISTHLGCIEIHHLTGSRPVLSEDGEDNDGKGRYPVLHSSQIDIRVVPQNGRSFGLVGPAVPVIPLWRKNDGIPFWIGVYLYPEAKDFAFDPNQVFLVFDGRQDIVPAGFTGPFSITEKNPNEGDPRGPCERELYNPDGWRAPRVPFYVIGEMCFGVMYKIVTPKPEEQFVISLKGLMKGGRPVDLPPIQFEKDSRWRWSFWPVMWKQE
jgi:hypothetical protein